MEPWQWILWGVVTLALLTALALIVMTRRQKREAARKAAATRQLREQVQKNAAWRQEATRVVRPPVQRQPAGEVPYADRIRRAVETDDERRARHQKLYADADRRRAADPEDPSPGYLAVVSQPDADPHTKHVHYDTHDTSWGSSDSGSHGSSSHSDSGSHSSSSHSDSGSTSSGSDGGSSGGGD